MITLSLDIIWQCVLCTEFRFRYVICPIIWQRCRVMVSQWPNQWCVTASQVKQGEQGNLFEFDSDVNWSKKKKCNHDHLDIQHFYLNDTYQLLGSLTFVPACLLCTFPGELQVKRRNLSIVRTLCPTHYTSLRHTMPGTMAHHVPSTSGLEHLVAGTGYLGPGNLMKAEKIQRCKTSNFLSIWVKTYFCIFRSYDASSK